MGRPDSDVRRQRFSDKGFKPDEDGNLAYGVEQKLPLWGRPKLARRVAEAETSMRESQVNYRLQQLRADITKALLTTALAGRVVEIGEQDLSWAEATAKATDNKYRAGQAVVADTLQIQNEVAKRNDALRTDRRRLAQRLRQLLQLSSLHSACPQGRSLLMLLPPNQRCQPALNQLIRCLQNEADAADVAQETFVRVYQNRSKFDTSQRFSTWLGEVKTCITPKR